MNLANAMATSMQGNYLVSRWQGDQADISWAWTLSTAFEIPLMLLCAYWVKRRPLKEILLFGMLGTVFKLVTLGLAEARWVYFMGLILHGAFWSGALVGFNLYVEKRFSVKDRPSLQALGAMFYQGLPSALGGLLAGAIWHQFGLRTVYITAAILSLVIGGYSLKFLPRLRE
jgi:hypothetical protein